jgi:UDP-N-acetylmuramate: L-alanyl-gamma-D-glutamyl-meso-diaminopimelate ligase
MAPGFLIGGVPQDFPVSARLGNSPFFVIEADEYDTAFFDKRSKFVHYHPRTLVLNNLEYDHADIFPDLAAIQRQFHHLVRIVPGNGQLVVPADQPALDAVLEMGCWSELVRTGVGEESGAAWQARLLSEDGSRFEVWFQGQCQGIVDWAHTGRHNVSNGLAALVAARHVGVRPQHGIEALCHFGGVKRRMELVGEVGGVCVYDDFAHHPTAIETTLAGLRARVGEAPIIAVVEPRSNTMRLGAHRAALAPSVGAASQVYWYQPPGLDWSLDEVVTQSPVPASLVRNTEALIEELVREARPGSHILIMSNGGFEGIHRRLVQALREREVSA